MYVQITSKCNMHCSHCGFACTSNGEDMSLFTFKKCLEFTDEFICLGGGEPTIHPEFEKILCLAIASVNYVSIITNGKLKERALLLAKLTQKNVIHAELSQDKFHEPIDKEVVRVFQALGTCRYNTSGFKAIRNTSENLIKSGRCLEGSEECFGCDVMIKPNGDIKPCDCLESPTVGNIHIHDYWEICQELNDIEAYQDSRCYKDISPRKLEELKFTFQFPKTEQNKCLSYTYS